MKQLRLRCGAEVLLDDGDLLLYGHLAWRLGTPARPGAPPYVIHAYRAGDGRTRTLFLHKLVADAAPGERIRHKNGDRLDNRRENLERAIYHYPCRPAGDWDVICSRYAGGERSGLLAREFDVTGEEICRQLEKRGIARREASEGKRIYRCNHAFFASIATEPQAYWLGFIAADGCIHRHSLTFALAARDKTHLQSLLAALESNHRIYERTHLSRLTGMPLLACQIEIRSPSICQDLAAHGVLPRKTFSLRWPDLPEDLLPHFLRGYFDGDGSCYLSARHQLCWSVTSNLLFLKDCQIFLSRRCGVATTKLDRRSVSPGIGQLRYQGNRQCARIRALLYTNASIWLPRKREIMEGHCD